MARPVRDPRRPDSRERLLSAASAEFATRGYDGVSVDRIASRARLNKAMVYYHFGSKAGLYREILRRMYRVIGARVQDLARGSDPPAAKVHAFVDVFVRELAANPQFPPIMMRELVERGAHMDAETVRLLLILPRTFAAILEEGYLAGRFRHVDPLLAYLSMLGPIALFTVSAPMRAHVASTLGEALPEPDVAALAAHVQALVSSMLATGDHGHE